ncbi:hypothetical protein B0A49_06731 [Cryomyces minteri]|uniref:Sulfotransferase domain-containing protein n=1 Tax=Cryomyces minteri TaxID=331657 RepID=A0A4U0XIH6_9PEZI|nr:hypothetical protein B0A49_06731 [Cryomyces minteri]
MLGYRPYHMYEAMRNPSRDLPLWTEALKAKYMGQGKPYGRAEFDKLFGQYDATTDLPPAQFVEELAKAYPDAKVVLTNRDVDEWLVSMDKTIFATLRSPVFRFFRYFDGECVGPFMDYGDVWLYSFSHSRLPDRVQCRKSYLDHYDRVRALVPRENLLELNLGDGWKPLCDFLEVPIPEGDYPNTNDAEAYAKVFNTPLLTRLALRAVGAVLAVIALPCAAVGAAWYFRRTIALS